MWSGPVGRGRRGLRYRHAVNSLRRPVCMKIPMEDIKGSKIMTVCKSLSTNLSTIMIKMRGDKNE